MATGCLYRDLPRPLRASEPAAAGQFGERSGGADKSCRGAHERMSSPAGGCVVVREDFPEYALKQKSVSSQELHTRSFLFPSTLNSPGFSPPLS